MRRLLASPLLLAAACFDPTFQDPACGPAGECPADLTCVGGVCRAMVTGDPDADPGAPDASLIDSDPGAPDAMIEPPDAAVGSPCADWSFSASNVPCTDPTGAWSLTSSLTYDTDAPPAAPASAIVAQLTGPSARVISVSALDVSAGVTLTLQGSLPLIILVHGTATIAGTIDGVAVATTPGAGGDHAQCAALGNEGVAGVNAGSCGTGGGGAGFGGQGARGGMCNTVQGGANGGIGGTALAPLRGGCRGGQGGNGSAAGALGGAGGGVIQISARDSITISLGASLLFGGGGGRGGAVTGNGGGGGGSGGAVLLEAPTISSQGAICAEGGGGGEAGGSSLPGGPGSSGICASQAQGGAGGQNSAGDGGDGSLSTLPPEDGGNGQSNSSGGGGGGGGSGVIRIRGASSLGGTITPTQTVVPL